MTDQRAIDLLAAHADALVGMPSAFRSHALAQRERAELGPLFGLAEELKASLPPVQPGRAFQRSLRREVVECAKRAAVRAERQRRSVLIGAAAVGSVMSIASVVTAIVVMVARARSRSTARAVMAR